MATFRIQDTQFDALIDIAPNTGITVRSVPYPYKIEFAPEGNVAARLEATIGATKDPFVLIDRRIFELYFAESSVLSAIPTLKFDATEENKTVTEAIKVAEFLEEAGATKQGTYFVIGGGIVQDIGAFSAAIYKRGMPFVFVPTTLLAQTDSCVGGKTGLNHRSTKNLMALFSAPRRVLIDVGFLRTLSKEDQLSGLGESFRLCVTGGPLFFEAFEKNLTRWFAGESDAIKDIIMQSLSVKHAVVEEDEFETDLRRSMNYGHSLGHALEALTDFEVPHGMAVTIGILLENEISYSESLLPENERARMLRVGLSLISNRGREALRNVDLGGVLDLLRRDKKTLGNVLKLVVVERIGQIRFIDFPLDSKGEVRIREALNRVLEAL